MSEIDNLLSRERSLRLREANLKREAQRCQQKADEFRRAAWAVQHRRGSELLEDVLAK